MNIENVIDHDFAGVISVRNANEIVYQQAFGFADLPNQIRNEVNTKFATASAGKLFIAVAILNLIEKGELSLSSCLGDVLHFDLHKIDPRITIQQLLNHTSGIPDYFDENSMKDYSELWRDYPNYKIRTSSDLLPLFINKPMMFPAGEKFKYSNSGYVVLGLVIEALTDRQFDKYLEHTVFHPFNMTNTGYYELDRLPAQCANSYLFDEKSKEFYTNIYSVDVKGTGAGGAYTTVTDIENFWLHLLNGTVISKPTVHEMLTPQVKERCYGYGVWLMESREQSAYPYFQGCDPGVSFMSSFDIKRNINVTLVSNFGCNVNAIHKRIVNAMMHI